MLLQLFKQVLRRIRIQRCTDENGIIRRKIRSVVQGIHGAAGRLHADEAVAAGDALGKAGEILADHLGRQPEHVFLAEKGFGAFGKVCGNAGIVLKNGRTGVVARFRSAAETARNCGGSLPETLLELLALRIGVGAHAAEHFDLIGDDVFCRAAVDGTDGDHRRQHGVTLTARDVLHSADYRSRRHDGIVGGVGCGAVTALADDADGEAILRRHDGAGGDGDLAEGDAGLHMSADDGIGRKTGKEACIKHGLCAHDGLFRRLENKQDIACKGILCGVEHHRCAKQDGDMHIVAAGVHHAGVFGADRIIGALRHGQRIDIRTDGNGFAGLCTADQADNTRFKPGGKGFDPKA